MGTYLLTIYVTLEQEKMIEKLFHDLQWTFRKKSFVPITDSSSPERDIRVWEGEIQDDHSDSWEEPSDHQEDPLGTDESNTACISSNSGDRAGEITSLQDSMAGIESKCDSDNLEGEIGEKGCTDVQEIDGTSDVSDGDFGNMVQTHFHPPEDVVESSVAVERTTSTEQDGGANDALAKNRKRIQLKTVKKRQRDTRLRAGKATDDRNSSCQEGKINTVKQRLSRSYQTPKHQRPSKGRTKNEKGLLPKASPDEQPSVTDQEMVDSDDEDLEVDKETEIKDSMLNKRPAFGLHFNSGSRLRDHQEGETCPTAANACPVCGKVYGKGDRESFEVHLRQHKGDLPYQCKDCGKRFAGKAYLNRHKVRHNQDVLYNCDICQKHFRQKELLRRHKKNMHGDRTKRFQCDICGNVFLYKGSLTQHYKSVHVSEKLFQCDLCDRKFKAAHNLRIHKVMHSQEKRDVCNICGKTFKRRSAYNVHMNRHQNKRKFSCGTCGKLFFEGREVTEHMRVHTGERPFKCDKCNYSCAIRGNLTKHMKVHEKEKVSTGNLTNVAKTQSVPNTELSSSMEMGDTSSLYTQENSNQVIQSNSGGVTLRNTPAYPSNSVGQEVGSVQEALLVSSVNKDGPQGDRLDPYLIGRAEDSGDLLIYRPDYLDTVPFGNIMISNL